MVFKPGDRVICTAPIDDLVKGQAYEVAFAATLKTEVGTEELIHLEGKHFGYMAFRFKLATNNYDSGTPLTAASISTRIGETVLIPFNYIDEGMVVNTASKNDQDKIDLSLIPYISQIEHAKAFMVGEKKYGRYNYCKGHKASQLAAAAERHLKAWFNGEEHDPKDGQHHLGSVMACCSMILRQQELGTINDDRYKSEASV